jgi:predicted 2-oxoglutarate/Fe(II)-dependent dioxygenase YbiX
MITHPGTQVPGKNVVVKAIEGSMVLFPSWLQHGVNPAIEGGERISIAFNAMITQFESDQPGVEGTTIVSASK